MEVPLTACLLVIIFMSERIRVNGISVVEFNFNESVRSLKNKYKN